MAKITAAKRRSLKSSQFALPGQGTGKGGKGPGSYPIDTKARARNALARGAQHASSSQLATIKRKVKSKYPGIKVGGKQFGGVATPPRAPRVAMPRPMAGIRTPRPPRSALSIRVPGRLSSSAGMQHGGVIPVIGSPKDHGTFKSMGIGR